MLADTRWTEGWAQTAALSAHFSTPITQASAKFHHPWKGTATIPAPCDDSLNPAWSGLRGQYV